MSVDKDTVRRIAKLARIALDEGRVEPMAQELNGIMAWVAQLNEVDVTGVPPMTSVVAAFVSILLACRPSNATARSPSVVRAPAAIS